jgi:YqaJ-like viral recombinase domain
MKDIFLALHALADAPMRVIETEAAPAPQKDFGTGRIRASEIASVFTSKLLTGAGLANLARNLAAELIGAKKGNFVSGAMEKGIENEITAIHYYAEKYGVIVDCVGESQAVFAVGDLVAKPDGLIFLPNAVKGVEVKCVESNERWGKVLARHEFMKHFSDYWIQCQFQMFLIECDGRFQCDVTDLVFYRNSTTELRIFRIEKDAQFIAHLYMVCDELRALKANYLETFQDDSVCVVGAQFEAQFEAEVPKKVPKAK